MGFAPLAIMAASSLLQAGSKISAAEVAAKESEVTASQIELGAVQREADRKTRLASAMASQVASSGARGISAFEGSPLTILNADIKAAETATQRDLFQADLEQMTLKARARVGKEAARTSAFTGLVGDFGKIAASA